MAEQDSDRLESQEMWVTTNEAAEITGYHHGYVRKLARDNWNLPEAERVIRVRRRFGRYDLWLADIVKYRDDIGAGPYPKLNTAS